MPLRKGLNTSGILFYAWVIPYGIALLILIFLYLKFFISLPAKTRKLFIIAAVVYLLGVIGIELMGGRIDEQNQQDVTQLMSSIAQSKRYLKWGGDCCVYLCIDVLYQY